jgi:anti-sigma factor RsiW
VREDDPPVGDDDLDAYLDGQLAPARLALVERYLRENPAADARVAADRAARDALRARLAFLRDEPIPGRLRIAAIQARRRGVLRQRGRVAAACVGLLLLGGVAGWEGRALMPVVPAGESTAARDALSAHRVYVVESVHPVEVAAVQQAHLVQWLSKRVGHKLVVPDLSSQGFALMGGRLLPAGGQAAAQFMFENGAGKRLTIYVRATPREDTSFTFAKADEFAAFAWVDDGLSFAMVAAVDRETLLGLADAVYRQLEPGKAVPALKPAL